MDPMQFLQQHFIAPILGNGWFNPYNTAGYAILLVIGVWYVYKLLVGKKVKIDFRFFLAVLPFIFWGSSTRVLHDAAVAGALPPGLNAFYIAPVFPTPGSYFITFGLALAALLASLLVERHLGFPYWKLMASAGTVLCIANIIMIPWVTIVPLVLILGLTALWTALFYPLTRILPEHFSTVSLGILSAHLLDASATFIALSMFGYVEQHVLPRLLIDLVGPISMFPLKILFIVPVLVIMEHYTMSGKGGASPGKGMSGLHFRNMLLITVLILGLAPGLRDLLRLMAMV